MATTNAQQGGPRLWKAVDDNGGSALLDCEWRGW